MVVWGVDDEVAVDGIDVVVGGVSVVVTFLPKRPASKPTATEKKKAITFFDLLNSDQEFLSLTFNRLGILW